MNKPYSQTTEGKKDKRSKKWAKQRKKHGCDDTEMWDLDVRLAHLIYPRIKFAVDNKCYSNRGGYVNEKEWDKILNKILYSFETYVGDEFLSSDAKTIKKVQEGLDLFAKYFMNLWN